MSKDAKVLRSTKSPMNGTRWCLDLDCGHEQWITSRRRPKMKTAICQEEHGETQERDSLKRQLASAEDRAKRAEAGIFELLERYRDCVKDWHEYHHTSEFNDCQVEVCKNARAAVKDYEDAKDARRRTGK